MRAGRSRRRCAGSSATTPKTCFRSSVCSRASPASSRCEDPSPDDAVAVARWWERTGAPERALPLYRTALPWLSASDDWSWAAHRLARLLRRAGEHAEAAAILRRLWAAGDEAGGVALAKHLEHRERDHAAAVAITQRLLDRGGLAAVPLLLEARAPAGEARAR